MEHLRYCNAPCKQARRATVTNPISAVDWTVRTRNEHSHWAAIGHNSRSETHTLTVSSSWCHSLCPASSRPFSPEAMSTRGLKSIYSRMNKSLATLDHFSLSLMRSVRRKWAVTFPRHLLQERDVHSHRPGHQHEAARGFVHHFRRQQIKAGLQFGGAAQGEDGPGWGQLHPPADVFS